MTVTTAELRPLLKRLKLGPMLDTLPERIALARRDGLDYADFLQIVLADEVSRRDHGRLELRLRQAGFEQLCRLEDFELVGTGPPRPQAARRRLLAALPPTAASTSCSSAPPASARASSPRRSATPPCAPGTASAS